MQDVYAFIERAAAAALADGEERFHALVDDPPFAIWVVGLQGEVLFVNRACREFCGWSEADLRKADFRVLLHPEDAARLLDGLRAALLEQREFEGEARVRSASGEWRLIRSHAAPRLSASGEFLGLVGTSSDVAARREAEEASRGERFRALFEGHMATMLLIEPDDGRIIDANAAAARFYGYTREQLRTMSIQQINQLSPQEVAAQRLRAVDRTLNEFVFPHRLADGEIRFVEVLSAPVTSEGRTALFSIIHDVTERTEAEEALRRNEALLRAVLDGTPDAVFLKDRDSRLLLANPATFAVIGKPAGECLGKTDEQFYDDPADGRAIMENDLRVMASGHSETVVETVGTPAGPRHYLSSKAPFRDAAGEVVGLLGVARDITERKQAEEALGQARSMLAEAQTIAHLGSFEYVAATRTTVWSEEEFRIFGLDPAGPSPSYEVMLAECIHPDDAPLLHETFTRALESGSTYELEHRVVRPDGSVRWVYDRADPHFDESGVFVRYVGATLDITDRKRTEEALRQSREDLDRAQAVGQIGWWRLDTRTGELTWSDENFRIFGVPKGTSLTYETFLARIHPDDRGFVDAQWSAGVRGEPYDIEHRIVVDGSVKWVREKAYLEYDGDGRLLGGFGITQDITARRETEEALRESEAERAAQQERARLARDLHDSVSQAIFAATLKAEALEMAAERADDGTAPAARQLCRLCKGALADLRAMLLELRGERLEDIPLEQLLRQLVEAAEGRTSVEVELSVRGLCGLPAAVHVAVYRVAQESLNNVARHARAERAWVEAECTEAGGRLEVRDDGCGFEVRSFGADHLGIRSMRERAAEVGAEFEVTSTEGRGTRVTLRWRTPRQRGD